MVRWLLASLTAPFLLLLSCAPSRESSVIRIGVIEPLSGAYAAAGRDEFDGIKLAHKLFPKVLGQNIELVPVDNRSDLNAARDAATYLSTQEPVHAVIGSWGSSLAIASGEILGRAGIPLVGASCTNPAVTANNPLAFRVCFVDTYQGEVTARYAYRQMGARRAFIVQEQGSEYSLGLANYFAAEFQKLSGPDAVVAREQIQAGQSDFNGIIERMALLAPDVVFMPAGYAESARLIAQARPRLGKLAFLGGDIWDVEAFLGLGGAALEGVVFASAFAADGGLTATGKLFLESWASDHDRRVGANAALGFDAYLVLHAALSQAKSSQPERIAAALAQVRSVEAVTGLISIDPERNAQKYAILKVVRNGYFRFLTTLE